MAKVLTAYRDNDSLVLTDAPFSLLAARGMGGADVRRVTARGPAQQGDTDYGWRLNPRTIELEIGIEATTDAELDGYRRTLQGFFRPLPSTPVKLRVTRDDGADRQIDCYVVDKVRIALAPELRPGHYHRATILLYAPNPTFYDPVPGTVSIQGSAGLAADWYLAGGLIGSARVLMQGGTPAQGQAWSYGGSIPSSTTWTLAVRMTQESLGTAVKYAFHVDNGASESDVSFRADTTEYKVGDAGGGQALGSAFMPSDTANYYFRHDPNRQLRPEWPFISDAITVNSDDIPLILSPGNVPIGGTARRWRSNAAGDASSYWGGSVIRYALYSPGLTKGEIDALDPFLSAAVGGTAYLSNSLNYTGDLPEYPTISITGPITSPRLLSAYTGHVLEFAGVTIGAGTTYVIDTRPTQKSVYAGTVNKKGDLSAWSDLGDFSITPDTVQGINVFYLTGTNTGTATTLSIVYNTRYSAS